jgi:ABC-type branched-subunit amino acid transport system substrate-binding protein
MNKAIGLWIDHREAVIVTLTRTSEQTRRLESGMEKHVRFAGGAQADTAEDMLDRRFNNHLNAYYAEVIAQIRAADAILIFGPGEAKGELQKQLAGAGLEARIVGVEAADKMTDRQIAARVRQQFL